MSSSVRGAGGGTDAKELVNSTGTTLADLEKVESGKVKVVGGLGDTVPNEVLEGNIFSSESGVNQAGTLGKQEKTVTAGTGAIKVNPDKGKLLSGVTVHPTPTETKRVTPSTSQQVITPTAGKHLNQVTVAGDADLLPQNIREGVELFGIAGTMKDGTKLYKVTHGTISEFSGRAEFSVKHGLGVVPDYVGIDDAGNDVSEKMSRVSIEKDNVSFKVSFGPSTITRVSNFDWVAVAKA